METQPLCLPFFRHRVWNLRSITKTVKEKCFIIRRQGSKCQLLYLLGHVSFGRGKRKHLGKNCCLWLICLLTFQYHKVTTDKKEKVFFVFVLVFVFFSYLCSRKLLERCSSGWRGTPGKRVTDKIGSQVRILFSPQKKWNHPKIHIFLRLLA